jgi:RecA-family ATPase
MDVQLNTDTGGVNLPDHVQQQLNEGPGVFASRHEAWESLSLQMVGNKIPDEKIFVILREWIPDTDKPNSELRRLIAGAHRRNPQPTTGAKRLDYQRHLDHRQPKIAIKQYEHDGSQDPLPTEELKMSYSDYFRSVLGFKDDECVWFAGMDELPAENGFTTKVVQWKESTPMTELAELDKACCGKGFTVRGSFYAVNPLKLKGDRNENNVSRYLYTMLEYDKIPREEQLARFRKSGLPIKALVDTGGSSIHAITKVDASSLEEYKSRVELLRAYIGQGVDKTGDAVRFTRLPNSPYEKGDKVGRTRLLAVNVGAASYDAWEETCVDDGMPDIQAPAEFLAERMELDPHVIDGLVRENSKMAITSKSKQGKTWMQLLMALCIGSGRPWLGYKTNKSPVLYINLELKANGLNNRVFDICEKIGLIPANCGVDFWNLRGKACDIEVMVNRILRRVKKREYKVVFLDPAYKCLGWRDENKAGDITDFQNNIERVATEAGCTIIVTGHAPKGDLTSRASNDMQSGSAVWSRDPDVVASFSACTDEEIIKEHGADCITIQFSGMRGPYSGSICC